MPYATQANMIARFGSAELQQLSDIANAGAIDDARVAQALTDASSKIDGYIASRYALPLPEPLPPMLEQLCCDMARYLLATRPNDEMRKRYEDAIAWLDKVAQGKIKLGGPTDSDPPLSGGAVGMSVGGRVFDANTLADWNYPPDRRTV